MNKLFQGIMPALITPFDQEGKLKVQSLRRIMDRELSKGVQGFYVNGATGEGLLLSEQTRMQLAEEAVDLCHARGAKVINHVGAVDTLSAIRLAAHAAQIGCDAISSLVPNYVQAYTQEQIMDYYRRLHDASGLPILVYCKGNVGTDPVSFMRSAMEVEGVIGCKYTMFNYYDMHRITLLHDGDINVINGPDEMLICGLTMGADGGIGSTYNVMPERYVALYRAFREGRFEEARQMQFEINRVIEVILKHGCIETIKEIFNLMGYDAGNVACPGKVFTSEQRAALSADLLQAGFILE